MPYKDRVKQKEAQKASYARNRVRYAQERRENKDHINTVKNNNREEKKAKVDEIKAKNPCEDCGVSYPPIVMDFDHVRGEKVASISVMVSSLASWALIEEEIAKCDLVCSNCHRLRTFAREQN